MLFRSGLTVASMTTGLVLYRWDAYDLVFVHTGAAVICYENVLNCTVAVGQAVEVGTILGTYQHPLRLRIYLYTTAETYQYVSFYDYSTAELKAILTRWCGNIAARLYQTETYNCTEGWVESSPFSSTHWLKGTGLTVTL